MHSPLLESSSHILLRGNPNFVEELGHFLSRTPSPPPLDRSLNRNYGKFICRDSSLVKFIIQMYGARLLRRWLQ